MVERRGGLADAGAKTEEAMQIVTDLFEREVLLALLPEVGEMACEEIDGSGLGRIVAAGKHGGPAAKGVVDNPDFTVPGGERRLGLGGGGVLREKFFFGLLGKYGIAGQHGGRADVACGCVVCGEASGSVKPVASRPIRAARLAMAIPARRPGRTGVH